MILFRYFIREILTSFFLITSLLFLILMSNEFVHYLNQVADGKFAVNILWKLVILESPRFLTILLPFSLFLAILFSYGRLYADYEMIALNACSFSPSQLTLMTLPLLITLSLVTGLLNLWLNPKLLNYRNKLLAQTGTAIEIQMARAGSFQQTNKGNRIIYVENISKDHKSVKNLFMAQLNHDKSYSTIAPWTIISAHSGYQQVNPYSQEAFFIAANGTQYQGAPGKKEYYITQFNTYGVRIDSHIGQTKNAQESLSTFALWHADNLHKARFSSELQWRLSTPIATLLLALLAIPLSRVNPRQGKYTHTLPAIAVYILYINLLLFGRNWIENGDISYQWGLWWIHGLLIVFILFAWCYTLGWNRVKNQLANLIKMIKIKR